jgi:hypothetical protein
MENNNIVNTPDKKNQTDGSKWAGIILVTIGAAILIKKSGIAFFPDYLFSWPVILIIVGLFSGFKSQFKNPGALIMIVVGSIFLWDRVVDDIDLRRFIIPAIIIGVGISLILRPQRNKCGSTRWPSASSLKEDATADNVINNSTNNNYDSENSNMEETYIKETYFLSGAKKIITSKNFKGGNISCLMGGVEIDLSQADIQGQAELTISAIMGGAQLTIPANWELRNEMKPFLGGVDDKRKITTPVINNRKVLILKGTAFMGGVEIGNY